MLMKGPTHKLLEEVQNMRRALFELDEQQNTAKKPFKIVQDCRKSFDMNYITRCAVKHERHYKRLRSVVRQMQECYNMKSMTSSLVK